MSENNIDALDIQIETSLGSDTAEQIGKASRAIKRLADNLSKIDTSPFERLNQLFKGTKEMESYASSIKSISTAIKGLSKIDQTGLANVKNTLKEISGIDYDFSKFKDLQNIDFSGLKKYGKELEKVQNVSAKKDGYIPGTPIGEDPSLTLNGVTKLRSEWDVFFSQEGQNADALKEKISGIGKTSESINSSGVGYQQYDTKKISDYVNSFAEKTDKASQKAKKAQDDFKKFQENLDKVVTPKINVESLRQLETVIHGLQNKYEKLQADFRNRQLFGEDIKTEPMKRLQVEIAKTEKMLSDATSQYQDLANVEMNKAFSDVSNQKKPVITGTNTEKLQVDLAKAQQKLKDLLYEGERIIKSPLGFNTSKLNENIVAIGNARLQIQALKDRIAELSTAGGKATTPFSQFGNTAKTAFSKLSPVLKSAGSGLKAIGGKLLSVGKNFVTSKIGANNFHNSLNGGFKTFLRYGLGIRSTFVLLNKLRSAFGGAMNNLVRYSSTTNKAISSMWNSLNALRNSLATAFAPVINSVAPYISSLIDMLTDGMNAIAQFFAAITGSKTVVVAKKQNKDYAASLGGIGSSAGNSADKVKDLADSLDLLDFDEINKLSDTTSNKGSGGSGGSSGSGGVSGMFETETVDSAFSELADLFKNGKWDEIGDIIADGINGALGKIDEAIKWDNVGEKITNVCNGITSIFNRVVDKMDWSMLGQTVGDGVNTVIYTINLLYDGVKWENLGSKVATAINGIFTTVDFDALGAFLVQKFNAVWEFAAGFFNTLDGKEIGTDIGTALNSAMQHLNLGAAQKALSGALKTLSDIIGAFNETVKWDDMTEKLKTNLTNFFTDVPWKDLGENLGTLFGNLLKVLLDTATDPEFLTALGQAGTDLIGGFFDALLTALLGDKWTAVKKAFEDVNNWLKDTGNKNTGYMVLNGITFDFEMNDETRKNLAGFIGKINSESVELRVDTKLLQSGDDAWKEYAEKWNKEKPELKIPDDVVNGGKETILKWLSDAYKENPELKPKVTTDKTGAEVAGEVIDDFEKEATRKGGAHFSDEPRQPGKKIADDVISDFNKSTAFGILGVETNKSGEQFRRDLANGFNNSNIGFNVDVQGKLKKDLDSSKIGTPSVVVTAKATKLNDDISNKTIGGGLLNLTKASDKIPQREKNISGGSMWLKTASMQSGKYATGQFRTTGNVTKTTANKAVSAQGEFKATKVTGFTAKLKKVFGIKAKGGAFSNGSWSNLPQFASGGFISSMSFGRFAGGGLPSHGTAFVAGESGAEIVGNVNGRTEVLNQSQIASAIYAAMIQAMKQQNVNVNVSLQGDANTMFKVVRNKARQYKIQTGKMPFA